MYLPAGQMHAYLKGVGIELMANSDNVLRGGLTPKHVDVPELLNVLDFNEQALDVIEPEKRHACEKRYPTPASEFELSVIEIVEGEAYASENDRGVEILLLTSGEVVIFQDSDPEPIRLSRGMSAIVPAAAESYRISGKGTLYKAGMPFCASK
jgi:mannose-6-phosphate isomerase